MPCENDETESLWIMGGIGVNWKILVVEKQVEKTWERV